MHIIISLSLNFLFKLIGPYHYEVEVLNLHETKLLKKGLGICLYCLKELERAQKLQRSSHALFNSTHWTHYIYCF